jgi:hypothetical protein
MEAKNDHPLSSDSAPDLYLGGELFKLLSEHRLPWQVLFGGFPQPLETNSIIVPQISPPPLIPNSCALDIR